MGALFGCHVMHWLCFYLWSCNCRSYSWGFFYWLFELKRSFEYFCDFLLVFGFKSMKEMNLSEGLDPKVVKKMSTKEGPCFCRRGPPNSFLSFYFFPCVSHFLFFNNTIKWQQWGSPPSLGAWAPSWPTCFIISKPYWGEGGCYLPPCGRHGWFSRRKQGRGNVNTPSTSFSSLFSCAPQEKER